MKACVFLAVLAGLVFSQAASVVTRDGAWCWFSEPRAIAWGGKTYTGWVTKNGDIVAASIDANTHAIDTFWMRPRLQVDDHANPSFFMWPDGRLYCFYTAHNDSRMRYRIMQTPGDFRSFGPEAGVPMANIIDYPCPHMLPAEDSALYVFFRGGTYWNPCFVKSMDRGATWDTLKRFIASPDRCYFKFIDNGRDEIHCIFTDGHPRNSNNNVYYVKYKAGALYKADGTYIKSMDSLPLLLTEAEKIYDANVNHAKAWVWDLMLDGRGYPVAAYVNFPTDYEHRYRYIRWDGSQWRDQELVNSGRWFPQTPAGDVESEPNYSGGIMLDHSNPFRLFMARQDSLSGVFGIERWISPDSGATWNKLKVIGGIDTLNVRPIIPWGSGSGMEFMYMTGTYVHYTEYNTSIRMVVTIDSTGPSAVSGLSAEVSQTAAVSLSWNAAADGESGVGGYEVFRGTRRDSLVRISVVRGGLSANDVFIRGADTLFYAIRAFNGNGVRGAFSNIAFTVLPAYVSAVLRSSRDTLGVWEAAEMTAYGQCDDGTVDSSNIGVAFLTLDTALVSVTPAGHVVAKWVAGTARVVARRGGVWLDDTCRIVTIGGNEPFLKRFDFRCTQAVTDTHWIPENGSAYDAGKGYGWTGCAAALEYRCDRAGGDLLGTFVMMRGASCTTSTFKVDAPDGGYIVRIGLGDASYPTEPLWVMFGSDTVARFANPGSLGNGYSVCDDTINVTGGLGASFLIRGAPNAKISYLVLLSNQGISMDDVAQDGLPPLAVAFRKGGSRTALTVAVLPNPFNPRTRIEVSGAREGMVQVYAPSGRLAARLNLMNGAAEWNAEKAPSGIYLVQTRIGDQTLCVKAVLLK